MTARVRLAAALAAVSVAWTLAACGRGPAGSANVPGIPVYPGARLTQQSSVPDQDPIDTYLVPDVTEDTVLDWYREQMPKHGWRANVVLYVDRQGCYGFVMATQNPNGQDVLLQLSQQRPGTACLDFTPGPTASDWPVHDGPS